VEEVTALPAFVQVGTGTVLQALVSGSASALVEVAGTGTVLLALGSASGLVEVATGTVLPVSGLASASVLVEVVVVEEGLSA
jgi:hypothetical protein